MTYVQGMRLIGRVLVVGIAYLVVMAGSVEDVEVTWAPSPGQTAAEFLIATHGCWASGGPDDVIPGHAVADVGNGPELVTSDVGFGIWLDGDPGQLFAFCP